MKKTVTITLTNQLHEVRRLKDFIEHFYTLKGTIQYHLNLVLEELFVNIVTYAIPHQVVISIEQNQQTITATIEDDGKEFDQFDVEYRHPENLSLDTIEDISIGLYLVHVFTDSHFYERKGSKNILTIKILDIPNKKTLTSMMTEKRHFPPPKTFQDQAHLKSMEEYRILYQQSIENPEAFWAEKAEDLHWFKKWDKVLETDFAEAKHAWFVGGKLNVCYNCLDRHLTAGRKDKIALIWEGNKPGEQKQLTYEALHREVCRFSNVLKKHRVRKGDRVTIYLPMIPELLIAVLACARIGAIHNVIFGGFSAESVRDRMIDCESNMLICANGYYRGDKLIMSKENADKAVADLPFVKSVIVVARTPHKVPMLQDRDYFWHEEMNQPDITCDSVCEELDSEDPLFILYTSGSTGKPKGVLHTQAGYLLYTYQTFKYVFDIKETDIYWCTADIGWITGHSYITYGPLSHGATVVMYEGIPTYPQQDRFWEIIDKYAVTIFYTAPTALRSLMREGDDWIFKHRLASLRLLGTVGEPINPEVWMWYYRVIGKERCPIVDTWWQTETGGILISSIPGAMPTKPGSASLPFLGIEPAVIKENLSDADVNEGGWLVIKKPWPGLMRRVYGNPERFKHTYFSQFYGVYTTGDGARRDEDGYYWLMGRIDDVINVSGHRFGTAEIESALVSHHGVAEAAVVGFPHEIKGQGIYAFVTLKTHVKKEPALVQELSQHVRKQIGAIATPDKIQFVDALPKTRSGKIMRRILTKIAKGEVDNLGDTSTLLDPSVIDVLVKERAC